MLAALLLAVVNALVTNPNGTPGWDGQLPPGSLPGFGISLIIGTVMGGLRHLTVRIYRQGTTRAS